MAHPPRKHRPPFATLPRHKRSDAVFCLKKKIQRDAKDYGGKFTSDLMLNEPGRPDLYNQWFDFYFPGTNKFTLWNATIITAKKAFWEKVNQLAYARRVSLLTPEEFAENTKIELVPAERSSTGKMLSYEHIQHEIRLEKFDGLTFDQQWHKLESDIARNDPPSIHESFQLDHSYVYGTGLHIVLDTETINQVSIETAIEKFFAHGETDWTSPEPVPRDRLPTVSEREALATLHPTKR